MDEAVPSLFIEVCVDSLASAVNAFNGGADRLEVCGSVSVGGGVTPSIGLVKSILKVIKDVPIMVMIRPRLGDFRYTNDELDVMFEDIASMKDLGVRGFVVGVLTEQGRVDIEAMKKLVDIILPLEVCFHRAFDMTRDAEEALRDIIDIGGISRILTSGHAPKVSDSLNGLERLFDTTKTLIEADVWGLTIMPGSGVNSKTVSPIIQHLLPRGLREIHLSGGQWLGSTMQFRKDGMGMGASPEHEWTIWQTRQKEIKKVRNMADIVWDTYWDTMSAEAHQEGVEVVEEPNSLLRFSS